MILKASQRGGGMALAAHLLKSENEHVEVHEIRGFVADDMKGAMKEAQAVAMGTRCKQHLFSVSLNPPASASVGVAAFESAIDRIEKKIGLAGQPRIIVFHEKEGRRHAHAVWSRIDADTMTARPLSFFKTKLRDVSKALYLEHGWQLPRGLIDAKERNPRSFTLAEWQQAKRMGRDPALLKAVAQECWVASDSRGSFEQALESRGLYLARGDRRAFVAVTYEGEVLALARLIGRKSKEVTAKLGQPDAARSVAETKAHIAEQIAPRLNGLINEVKAERTRALVPLHERRDAMRLEHRAERQRLDEGQRSRFQAETKERASRFRTGVVGLWDRLTGRHGQTVKHNDADALASMRRDRGQRDDLVASQLGERRGLQRDIVAVRQRHATTMLELHRDLKGQDTGQQNDPSSLKDSFRDAAVPSRSSPRTILRGRGSGRDSQSAAKSRGPDLGR